MVYFWYGKRRGEGWFVQLDQTVLSGPNKTYELALQYARYRGFIRKK